jgi:hypothetical protein
MSNGQMTIFEVLEKAHEKTLNDDISDKAELLFLSGPSGRSCVICRTEFSPRRLSANVCSAECRRQRRLRYGATYRQDIRQKRAEILAMFGGRPPTHEELSRLIQQRKGRP